MRRHFFNKTFDTPKNIGNVNGKPILFLSVQPIKSGERVSLWTRAGQREHGDQPLQLALTEDQLMLICEAYRLALEDERRRSAGQRVKG